jgi:cytochrome c oxidase assembly protein Cox11
MVLIFAPAALANQTELPCSGLEEWNYLRPAQSPAFSQGNLISGAVLIMLIPPVLIKLWLLRKHPYLLSRTFVSTVLLSIGYFFAIAIALLRKGLVDETGRLSMSCNAVLYVYACVPFFAVIAHLLRYLHLVNRKSVTDVVANRAQEIEIDDMASTVGSTVSSYRESSTALLTKVKEALASVFAVNQRQRRGTVTTVTRQEQDRRVAAIRFANSNLIAYLLTAMCAFVWLLPSIITAFIVPVYVNICQGGCDVYLEVIFVIFVPYLLFMPIEIIMIRKLVGDDDVDNMGRDMTRGNIASITLYILCWALKAGDPGMLDYANVVSYEWIFAAATCTTWALEVVSPMVVVMRSTNKKTSVTSGEAVTSDMLRACLTSPEEATQFEEYMKGKYAFENFRFLVDILAWKQMYHEKGDSWRVGGIELLYGARGFFILGWGVFFEGIHGIFKNTLSWGVVFEEITRDSIQYIICPSSIRHSFVVPYFRCLRQFTLDEFSFSRNIFEFLETYLHKSIKINKNITR